jgi:hypothetical protein
MQVPTHIWHQLTMVAAWWVYDLDDSYIEYTIGPYFHRREMQVED